MELREIADHPIRLLAFDLDGTLLKDDKCVSERTEKALENAAKAGLFIMAATGRPLNAIPEQILKIPGIRYLLNGNGANIYDLQEEMTIYRANMTPDQVAHTLDFLEPLDIWHEVLIDGVSYVEWSKFERMEEYVRAESMEYLTRTREPVPDLRAFVAENEELLEKVCCFFRNGEECRRVKLHFPLRDDLCTQEASDVNYEIADRESTKGCALRHMVSILGISLDEAMAFGDAMNDADMLKTAGIGVAMGNAFPELQAIADYVTLSNQEDGVAVVIEEILNTR